MDRRGFESSAFKRAGYDPNSQTLEIEFHPRKSDGRVQVCQYSPVSQALWDELCAPSDGSSGRVFIQKIKGNPSLTCTDVTEEQAVTS
jgi:hypothetical protein